MPPLAAAARCSAAGAATVPSNADSRGNGEAPLYARCQSGSP